jgi:uncharacterized HAD superfamily protein
MRADCRTIYVDLDDVLCHAARHFLLVVEREFGKQMSYEQLTNFDVGHSCGLSAAERDELYRIVHRADELLSMAPIAEAIAVLSNWVTHGYEIAIVTGRPPESAEVSLEWLARHRITHHSFTVVDKYARFAATSARAITLDELSSRRFCWAVEDSLPMAQYLAGRMQVPVALLDRPWNQCSEEDGIARCHDWASLDATVLKLASFERR